MQIVYFHQSNAGRVVYTAHNRGVVTRWQLRNDCRLAWIRWSVTAVLMSCTWLLVIIPPIIVCCQLSLEAIKAPRASCSSNVGLANALGMLYGGAASSGPMARIITSFARVP